MDDVPSPARVGALLRWAAAQLRRSPTAMIDARALAKAAFRLDDAGLILCDGFVPEREPVDEFIAMVRRRAGEEPVAHIVGKREFWSLEIELAPGILVPRTDTEILIETILAKRDRRDPLRVLDLGCGSGAILCALLTEFRAAEGVGADIDPAAVETTMRNLRRLGLSHRSNAVESDWFSGLEGRFDIIVSNPPYIPIADRGFLPREVRDFENPLALFGGEDGLAAYRVILGGARNRLASDGLLALEIGWEQAESVNTMAAAAFPDAQIAVKNDLEGRNRGVFVDLRPSAH